MFNHAPPGYDCPFCALVNGDVCASLHSTPEDIILRTGEVMALVASHWWKKNPGHVLVIPVRHFENLYDLPDDVGDEIFAISKLIAVAMKHGYGCAGISTRQHNEPAGYQEVWHYHLHIFPRYPNDNLYAEDGNKFLAEPTVRKEYAKRLMNALQLP